MKTTEINWKTALLWNAATEAVYTITDAGEDQSPPKELQNHRIADIENIKKQFADQVNGEDINLEDLDNSTLGVVKYGLDITNDTDNTTLFGLIYGDLLEAEDISREEAANDFQTRVVDNKVIQTLPDNVQAVLAGRSA